MTPQIGTEKEMLLDFNSFEEKLGTWAKKFRPFFESKEMWDIMQKIKEDAKEDTIVPLSKDTFNVFKTTEQRKLKVIFYLQDPYPRMYKGGVPHATGIAMDCSHTPNGKLQPSLELFYDAVERETGKKVTRDKSLQYLHDQGVMMLNTDLTCKLNKSQSHEGLWLPFQKYFLEEIMGADTHIIYVLCGKSSKKMKPYITPFARVLEVEHPAAAAHRNGDWESKGIFKQINNILRDNDQEMIVWDKKEWEEVDDLPF